jgi:hypothetical protein
VGQFISKKFMIASRWRYQAAKRQGETMTDKFRFCSLYRDELGRCPGTASRLRPAKGDHAAFDRETLDCARLHIAKAERQESSLRSPNSSACYRSSWPRNDPMRVQ